MTYRGQPTEQAFADCGYFESSPSAAFGAVVSPVVTTPQFLIPSQLAQVLQLSTPHTALNTFFFQTNRRDFSFPAYCVMQWFTSGFIIQYSARPGQTEPRLQWLPHIQHHINSYAIWSPVLLWPTCFCRINQQHRTAGLFKRSFSVPAAVPQVRLLSNNQRDLHCHHLHCLHRGSAGLCAAGSRLPSRTGHVSPDAVPLSWLPGCRGWPGLSLASLCHCSPLLLSCRAGDCHRGQREAQAEKWRRQNSWAHCDFIWSFVRWVHTQ